MPTRVPSRSSGDQPDREAGRPSGAAGRAPAGRRPARGRSIRATRSRPARSGTIVRLPAGQRARRARPSGRALVRADLEERQRRPAQSTRASCSSRRRISVEPVRAAVEGHRRLERGGDRQPGDRARRDVRQVGGDDVEQGRRPRAAGRPAANWIRSATPWPTAFSRASWSASGEVSVAMSSTSPSIRAPAQLDRQGDRDRPGARSRRRSTRSGGVPGGPRRARSAGRTISAEDQVDEQLGLRPRDQRPGSVDRASPWNSLKPADVGDRLAARSGGRGRPRRPRPRRPRPAPRNGRSAPSDRPAGRGRGGARRRAAGCPSRPSARRSIPAWSRKATVIRGHASSGLERPTGAARPGRS